MAAAIDQVAAAWREVAARHRSSGSEAILAEPVGAYGETHRHYHTLEHIAALLRLVDKHGSGIADRDAVVLAILFHDAVYNPSRQDNEKASAVLAAERLGALSFPGELVRKISRYILATEHGSGADVLADPDLAILLDFDLSVLAASPGEYLAYAEDIRREYAQYPDAIYRPGRQRVLQNFLEQENIYRVEPLRALWERQARANIADEIASLT